MTRRDDDGRSWLRSRLVTVWLGACAVIVIACLTATVLVIRANGAGDGFIDQVGSVVEDDVPGGDDVQDRADVLKAATDFVVALNTYGPDMVDADNDLPEYEAVGELMTSKFRDCFTDVEAGGLEVAKQIVLRLGAESSATVNAAGVASIDGDSATVIVGGVIEVSAVYQEESQQQTSDDEGPRISSPPKDFRYQVSLDRVEDEWLVDDVDDIDDGQPTFSTCAPISGGQPGDVPTDAPTDAPTQPSDGSSTPSGQEGTP